MENTPHDHQFFVTNQHSCNSPSFASVSMITTDDLLLLGHKFVRILLWPFGFG